MKKQKEISTLLGLVIIIIVAVVFLDITVVYQNFAIKQVLNLLVQSCS